ncbi:MAG: TetR/AcrR family transcriptional regulator [Chloroflexi bacterium]|nr:MAG: TetR/AcrR family transcriptional regulator [Chloroflexota bacterium]TME47473.1 MAG: TetR/AcrR family transcriptional regulator [Chloroflexota bacterium]
MDRNGEAVKSRRRYDSRRRREEALRTRDAVLNAAERLFLTRGYGRTTIASVARAAKVSVETIYKGFSGKPGLVRAIWDKGLAGLGPVPAWQRSDEMASEEEDPRNVIRNWGVLTTEVAPRAAPILLLVRAAAATDPEMAALLKETDQERLVRMEQNARRLFGRAGLRDGLTIEEARDIMWAYSSPELYETLVLRRGWPLDRYGRFVAEGMIAALLP